MLRIRKRSVRVDLFGGCRENGCSRPQASDGDFAVVVEETVVACGRTLANFSNKESASHRSVDEFRELLWALVEANLSSSMQN